MGCSWAREVYIPKSVQLARISTGCADSCLVFDSTADFLPSERQPVFRSVSKSTGKSNLCVRIAHFARSAGCCGFDGRKSLLRRKNCVSRLDSSRREVHSPPAWDIFPPGESRRLFGFDARLKYSDRVVCLRSCFVERATFFGSSAISLGRKAKFCQPDSIWTARGLLLAILGEKMRGLNGVFLVARGIYCGES